MGLGAKPLPELVACLAAEHLGHSDLAALEASGAVKLGLPCLVRAWRILGRATGAVECLTGAIVGDGDSPKMELLSFLRGRSSFVPPSALRQGFADVPPPEVCCSSSGSQREAPSALLSRPELSESPDPADAAAAAGDRAAAPLQLPPLQLHRSRRRIAPLAFGVRRGTPLYAEFRFTWREQGNGEACQLGVIPQGSIGAPLPTVDDLALVFSPSAGAVFRGAAGGCFRAWPLEDTWVDTSPRGSHHCLQAGIFVAESGHVSFMRRGPMRVPGGKDLSDCTEWPEAQLPWEVTGGFSVPREAGKPGPSKLHVALCFVDSMTHLRAELLRVASAPPVPQLGMNEVPWYWKADD